MYPPIHVISYHACMHPSSNGDQDRLIAHQVVSMAPAAPPVVARGTRGARSVDWSKLCGGVADPYQVSWLGPEFQVDLRGYSCFLQILRSHFFLNSWGDYCEGVLFSILVKQNTSYPSSMVVFAPTCVGFRPHLGLHNPDMRKTDMCRLFMKTNFFSCRVILSTMSHNFRISGTTVN